MDDPNKTHNTELTILLNIQLQQKIPKTTSETTNEIIFLLLKVVLYLRELRPFLLFV